MHLIAALLTASVLLLWPTIARATSTADAELITSLICANNSTTRPLSTSSEETSCSFEFIDDGGVRYVVEYLSETSTKTVLLQKGPSTRIDTERYLTFSIFDASLYGGTGDPIPVPRLYVSLHIWDLPFLGEVNTGMECHAGRYGACTMMIDRFDRFQFDDASESTGIEHMAKWQGVLDHAVRVTLHKLQTLNKQSKLEK